jgi:hypothetical protein
MRKTSPNVTIKPSKKIMIGLVGRRGAKIVASEPLPTVVRRTRADGLMPALA